MRVKKQVLSDAIIAWMQYKRDLIKVPEYCTPKIERIIKGWSYQILIQVIDKIKLNAKLFHSDSCPFCIAHNFICSDCKFGDINGICDEYYGLWYQYQLHSKRTKPANRKKFASIFSKLKKELLLN